jgi:hypothetical protein
MKNMLKIIPLRLFYDFNLLTGLRLFMSEISSVRGLFLVRFLLCTIRLIREIRLSRSALACLGNYGRCLQAFMSSRRNI